MSRWQSLPIVGGAYQDDTRPWSSQDTINYIPVQAERTGTRTRSILRCAPGFNLFSGAAQGSPCRKLHNIEGTLYAVIGSSLYRFDLDGTVSSLGSIPGVERVSMAHNQIARGNQLAIAANNAGYVYDTTTDTLTQITDDGFAGALFFNFIDQYIVGIDPSRSFGFNSALADATSYNTLDRVQAEAQPDKLTGQAVTHDELWLFGERTIQPCSKRTLTPDNSFAPFETVPNLVLEVGCASGHTICNMDSSLFWLGNDGIVYRANGYSPMRISTHPVEQAISRCNRANAFAFTFEDRGHKIYYLTFPDGETWGFDAASGEWHRRKSYGMDRWRISDLVYWNGKWIAGDAINGKLYTLDWDAQEEDGAILERRRILSVISDDDNPISVNAVEIIADTGEEGATSVDNDLVLSIDGDLPDGFVGQALDFQYTIKQNRGIASVEVTTGALPTGTDIDDTGKVTGTVTAADTYTWTVTITDDDGNTATVDDSAVFTEVMAAQLSDWKYLQVEDTDDTDRSAVDFDDSGWSIGTAPFGAWYNGDPSLENAHAYNLAFAADFATTWDVNTRLWLRRTLTLAAVPSGGIDITYYMDDHFTIYVNGTEIFNSTADDPLSGSGSTFTIADSNLVVGDNCIAILCHDEEPPGTTSVTYFDMFVDAA